MSKGSIIRDAAGKEIGKMVIGIETELGIGLRDNKKKEFITSLKNEDDVGNVFLENVLPEGDPFPHLENGARIYIDNGGHPEYATPECASVHDVVVYEKALEQYLGSRIPGINERHADEFGGKTLIVLKNNADSKNHTWGCHENYLTHETLWKVLTQASCNHPLAQFFFRFLATRIIFCGSGTIRKPFRFELSQRAPFIRVLRSSSASGGDRPFIKSNDESLTSKEPSLKRLEITVGDSNMSEWSTYLKVGTTRTVLRALHKMQKMKYQPALDSHLTELPIQLLHTVSYHADSLRPLATHGFRVNACNIQWMIFEAVQRILGEDMDIEDKVTAKHWENILVHIERRNDAYLSRRLDFAIKKRLFDRKLELLGMDPQMFGANSPAKKIEKCFWLLADIDCRYHDISQEGIYNILAATNRVDTLLKPQKIAYAKTMPPKTRAWWRGMSLKYARAQKKRGEKGVTIQTAIGGYREARRDAWESFECIVEDEKGRIKKQTFKNGLPWHTDWSDVKQFIDEP